MEKHRVPRWVAVAVPLTFFGGVVFCAAFYGLAITRDRIPSPSHTLPASTTGSGEPPFDWFESQFVGHRDDAIVARYGPATDRCNGYHGDPPMVVKRTYPEAFTYVYAHSSGSLYLSFCRQRGKWVCFSANWVPHGM